MTQNNAKFDVPNAVLEIVKTLKNKGFEAYLVGGCVRDLIIGREPKDWDITTNAKPEEIQGLFPKTVYENDFGTVAVINEEIEDPKLKVVEVTPYRLETSYSDHRHPDEVTFSDKLEDDLKRRDFTCNSIAYEPIENKIVDPFDGQKDIKEKVLKTVGKAEDRFEEDALRMLRAVRFHVELNFEVSRETKEAVLVKSKLLDKISRERIRDEFVKIIMSDRPADGIDMARNLDILKFIVPELEHGLGVEQTQAHAFDVYTHLLKSLQHSAKKKYPLHIRLAALFHDVSKPETRRRQGNKWTFYGHEVVGARVTREIMNRLRFSKDLTDTVVKLVRWHMFFSDTETITHSAVRRMVANVSRENVWDLMNVRICDRIGTGRPKENPFRLRKYHAMIEEVLRDPISVGMLKIDGNTLMKELHVKPGPRMGWILHALLEQVLEDPKLNDSEKLKKMAQELDKLVDKELKEMGEKGKQKREEEDEKIVSEIRKKHWVK